MVTTFPVFALVIVYCLWDHYRCDRLRRARILRERVAFLLWVVAHAADEPRAIAAPKRMPYARRWESPDSARGERR